MLPPPLPPDAWVTVVVEPEFCVIMQSVFHVANSCGAVVLGTGVGPESEPPLLQASSSTVAATERVELIFLNWGIR